MDIMESIAGTVENIVYRNEANDYTVLELSDGDNLITAVGQIPQIAEGELLELRGRFTYHKEFGRQFAFVAYEKSLPKEIDGIIQYLSSRVIKGVGPVTALKIVNKFGTDSFDVIENHPEWLSDISGITMKKAAVISESFKAQTELRQVMMFFKDYASATEVTRIYKKLGVGAIGVVKSNPYILCDGEYSIGFDKADRIAASLGFSPLAEERVLSGLKYILEYNATLNGHTCLPTEKLVSATAALLGIDEGEVNVRLTALIASEELAIYSEGEAQYVMRTEVAEDEIYIAHRLRELATGVAGFSAVDVATMIQAVESNSGIRYAELQRLALFRALNSGVTVITGGPGTGKTTVVKALIALFKNIGLRTVLAAPTGRAAKRMSEATGAEAKTIHRMLEMERTSASEAVFNRNVRNPIDESVIIVDEASMIDLSLMAALMRALPRGARLILIGDSDQLPSVGAGNVLSDIIASEAVDTISLCEIFRQSKESLIITNAHNINAGVPPVLNVTDNDFFFVRREDEQLIAETVASLVMDRLPKTYGEGIREKIQVITPSKKGYGGVEVLNRELQQRINPAAKFKKEKAAHGTVFREGDKVMQIANNYDLQWEKRGIEGSGIFNGDIGVIKTINMKDECMSILFDDRAVEYPFENLDELELAYAITVHKSQGSEYPVVIIPMYSTPPMLMTRNLLYTAITRARQMVILVGRSDIPARMVENNREILRYTTLRRRFSQD